MKEKDMKFCSTVGGRGWLMALGLGCSFLGSGPLWAAVAVPYTTSKSVQVTAGRDIGNVQGFDESGALSEATTGASIFHTPEDRIVMASDQDQIVRTIFDKADEGEKFAPTVKNGDLTVVQTSLKDDGNIDNALDAMAAAAHKAAARKMVNAIGVALGGDDAIGDDAAASPRKAIYTHLNAAARNFADAAAVTTALTAIRNNSEDAATALVANAGEGANADAVKNAANDANTAITTEGPNANKMVAEFVNPLTAEAEAVLGAIEDNRAVYGDGGALGNPDSGLKATLDAAIARVGDSEAIYTAAYNCIREKMGNDASEYLTGAVENKEHPAFPAAMEVIAEAARGLFNVEPGKNATSPRYFTVQISARDLKNGLNLSNNADAASGLFLKVNGKNLSTGDTILLALENTKVMNNEGQLEYHDLKGDVSFGDILFTPINAEAKTVDLVIAHAIAAADNKASKKVTFGKIYSIEQEGHKKIDLYLGGFYEAAKGDVNLKFGDVSVNKLFLGIPSRNALMANPDESYTYRELNPQDVSVQFEALTTADDITVLGNCKLIADMLLTGNIQLKEGSALDLSLGNAIQSTTDQSASIDVNQGAMLSLSKDLKLSVHEHDEKVEFYTINLNQGTLDLGDQTLTLNEIRDDKTEFNGSKEPSRIIYVTKSGEITSNGKAKISMEGSNRGAHAIQVADETILMLSGKLEIDTITANDPAGGYAIITGDGSRLILNGATIITNGNVKLGDKNVVVFNIPENINETHTFLDLQNNGTLAIGNEAAFIVSDAALVDALGTTAALEKMNGAVAAGLVLVNGTITASISVDTVKLNTFIKGLATIIEGNNLKLAGSDLTVLNDIREALPGVDWSHVSPEIISLINDELKKARQERSALSKLLCDNVMKDDDQAGLALQSLSRSTVEEKARTALQLINSARSVIYDNLGKAPTPGKNHNLWASTFGDLAHNNVSGYKMSCDIYGFAAGIDTQLNDAWSLGFVGGYGKTKSHYKGGFNLPNTSPNCDQKSYFGGAYGMWSNLAEDLNIKFSVLAGHSKFEEAIGAYDLFRNEASQYDSSHHGSWISGNIDCTSKRWNFGGFNMGPWASLSIANVHQKSHSYTMDNGGEGELNQQVTRKVRSSDRRSIETILGIAVDRECGAGTLELAVGYKHDFRHLGGGKGVLSLAGEAPAAEQEISLFNTKSGRDSIVAKAGLNMKFNDFGIFLGVHGQAGNHFKDIAGSITASYSF